MMVVVENLINTIKLEFKRFCLSGILVIINFIIKILPLERPHIKQKAGISNSGEKSIIYLSSCIWGKTPQVCKSKKEHLPESGRHKIAI